MVTAGAIEPYRASGLAENVAVSCSRFLLPTDTTVALDIGRRGRQAIGVGQP